MKIQLIFVMTIFCMATACINKEPSSTNAEYPTNQDSLTILKKEKALIDTAYQQHKNDLIVFVKPVNKDTLIEVKNDQFPPNILTTFNVLKNSAGKTLSISEYPFSESGDWNIRLTHYFDQAGKTFAFEREARFFNSICTDGIAIESLTIFYNQSFQPIHKLYNLVDANNKPLKKDSCQFPYNYTYHISPELKPLEKFIP
jgi:hypothetical protein